MQPQISIITLRVKDSNKAIQFDRDAYDLPMLGTTGRFAFFELQGPCLALYPLKDLVKDIGGAALPSSPVFSSITLAHNLSFKEEVDLAMKEAKQGGNDD